MEINSLNSFCKILWQLSEVMLVMMMITMMTKMEMAMTDDDNDLMENARTQDLVCDLLESLLVFRQCISDVKNCIDIFLITIIIIIIT